MANYLASIFGTEQDKVNCSFYYKIGACRHGDRCSRKHNKPAYSQTVLLTNIWHDPSKEPGANMSPEQAQAAFDNFYEDLLVKLWEFGEVEELVVCGNSNDHLLGNVYARYKYEARAAECVAALNDDWYDSRPIYAELSPVTDFREACCRLNSGEGCQRGGFCNFIHRKLPTPEWEEDLRLACLKQKQIDGRDPLSRDPSSEPEDAAQRQ